MAVPTILTLTNEEEMKELVKKYSKSSADKASKEFDII